jgi:hypothetical protein
MISAGAGQDWPAAAPKVSKDAEAAAQNVVKEDGVL